MFNLQMVIEFLTKLNASVTAVDNFDSELEEIKGRLHNLESNGDIKQAVEDVLADKDYLDAYEVNDKIEDGVAIAVDGIDWNDKVRESCQELSWSVRVD